LHGFSFDFSSSGGVVAARSKAGTESRAVMEISRALGYSSET
jgi:hypothetical protein